MPKTYWTAVTPDTSEEARKLIHEINCYANNSYNGFKTRKACQETIKDVMATYHGKPVMIMAMKILWNVKIEPYKTEPGHKPVDYNPAETY